MSDVEQGGITAQPAAPAEPQAPEPGQPNTANVADPNGIPQKFLEASKIDVIRSFQELEREKGRLSNELGEARKSQEESAEKYKQLEAQRFAQPIQSPTAQPVQQAPIQQEQDPFSILESKFDDDPKAAIRAALESQNQLAQRQLDQQFMTQQAQKANEFYYEQKENNPDFARREPVMQQLNSQFGHMIKKEYQNSAEVIRALDLMSKGYDLEFYKKAAVEDTQKHRASVTEEKRRAQSEPANSEGDAIVDTAKMSNKEYIKFMEENYGYADKD